MNSKGVFQQAGKLRSSDDWLSELERVERAVARAAELGRPDGLWSKVVGHAEGAVREYEGVRFDRPRRGSWRSSRSIG